MSTKMDVRKYIKIRGANENNLKNIDVDIPRNELVVLTGLSGSGKSSLAFDTIYAEGQRRYMESLSSYARQFLGQMEKPDVESIEGLSPAISIDQKSTNRNPRSTVGTVTEIYDYFRLLYARIGIPHCPKCGQEIKRQTVDQIVDEIIRRFVLQIEERYPGDDGKVARMAILYDGQVKMAHLAIAAGYSVNGVARLHTEILKNEQLHDFYEMFPEKFNNKTNGITQRRFLMHGNPLLADWVTDKLGTKDWITDLSLMSGLKKWVDDEEALKEFMSIKYENKVRLAKYIKEHNGIEVDPRSIFDVQVKRLHEYKRQLLNILHVMYLYNEIKEHPEISFYPRTFIFGAKASAGYIRAKQIIKLINSVADVVNNDRSINGKLKVVFIEDYRVSNAEIIFAAADVSEQISTASKEASGTGNMKFMLNGAPTLGTMDGANVEIVEEVGAENAFIFGLSSDEVINYENNGGYNPMDIYNSDADIRRVVNQLVDGTYSQGDKEMYRDLYNSLLTAQGGSKADTYFILKDFRSYADTQKKVEEAYRDKDRWAKMALLNTASCGKFSSDRTIQEYVDDIWHLDKVTVDV